MATLAPLAAGLAVWMLILGVDLLREEHRSRVYSLLHLGAQAGDGESTRRLVGGFGALVAPWMSPAAYEALERRLVWAGEPMQADTFIGLRVALAFVGLVAGLGLAALGLPAVVAVVLAGVGYLLPEWWLTQKVQQRQQAVRRAEPLFSDLLSTALAAGMELTPALERLIPYVQGPLGDELRRAWREILTGVPRAEALQGVAHRTGVESIEQLVRTIRTAEQYGTPVAQAIHEHARTVRELRRHRAEALARAASSKMIGPIVLLFLAYGALLVAPAIPMTQQVLRLR